jgi:hypothetical protein
MLLSWRDTEYDAGSPASWLTWDEQQAELQPQGRLSFPARLGTCRMGRAARSFSLVLMLFVVCCSPQRVACAYSPPWVSTVSSSQVIHEGGATIQIDFAPGPLDLPTSRVIDWVHQAALAVSTYYGRYPVARARILIVPSADRHGVLRGTTWGGVGGFPAFTRMVIGEHTLDQELANDWTMTHELIHTALPSLADEHHWLEEGSATYIEPIARVQIGSLSTEKIWADMVRDMHKGEPGSGDEGLDQTHTWGRTYWGGAIFCLVADVTIRERTNNRKGLQDALRAVVAAGGTIDKEWPISRALAIGDQATGTAVLADLYSQMSKSPSPVDLDQLWQSLGIHDQQGQISFDDHAPLAAIRKKITAREP